MDWLLPLIHQVKNQFQIYAILENKRELNILKRNNFLFERFKDYFDGYFIENKFKNFFSRIKLKILILFLNNTKHEKILNDFNSKYFSFEELMKNVDDINLKDLKEINLFISYDKIFNNWQQEISKIPATKTFYYPSSCSLKPINKDKNFKCENIPVEKNKYLLLSNELDSDYWKKYYPQLKQFVIGYPRFSKKWIDSIVSPHQNNTDSIRIYLSYRREIDNQKWFDKAKEQLDIVKNALMAFNKNFEVYVKIHPYTNQSEIDKKIQSEKNIKFYFSNNHQQEICKGCDFSINFFRSASIMESLSTNTPAIELWNLSNDNIGSPYKDYEISFYVNNQDEFQSVLDDLIEKNNKIKQDFNNRYKVFSEKFLKKNPYERFAQLLKQK